MSEEVTWKKARHMISGRGSTDQAADMDDRIIELDQHKLRESLIKQDQDRIQERLESQRTPEGAVSVTPNLCSNCRETQEVLKLSTNFGEELHRGIKKMLVLVAGIEDFRRPKFEVALAQLQGLADNLELRLKADDCERVKLRATNRRLAKQVEQLSKQIDSERQEADKRKEKVNLNLKMTKQQLGDSELDFDWLDMQLQDVQRKLEGRQPMPSLDFPPTEDENEDQDDQLESAGAEEVAQWSRGEPRVSSC